MNGRNFPDSAGPISWQLQLIRDGDLKQGLTSSLRHPANNVQGLSKSQGLSESVVKHPKNASDRRFEMA